MQEKGEAGREERERERDKDLKTNLVGILMYVNVGLTVLSKGREAVESGKQLLNHTTLYPRRRKSWYRIPYLQN